MIEPARRRARVRAGGWLSVVVLLALAALALAGVPLAKRLDEGLTPEEYNDTDGFKAQGGVGAHSRRRLLSEATTDERPSLYAGEVRCAPHVAPGSRPHPPNPRGCLHVPYLVLRPLSVRFCSARPLPHP